MEVKRQSSLFHFRQHIKTSALSLSNPRWFSMEDQVSLESDRGKTFTKAAEKILSVLPTAPGQVNIYTLSPNRSRQVQPRLIVCLSVCVSVTQYLNAYVSETNYDTTMKLGRYVGSLVRLIVLKFHELRKCYYVTMI